MIDFHSRKNSIFFEYPINLLLFAPHEIPVVVVGLLPVAMDQGIIDTIFEIGLELNIRTEMREKDTVGWGNATS
jgi:hypothetical protein